MPFVRVLKQRTEGDCGIVALAMLLSRSYEDILEALSRIKHGPVHPHRRGIYIRDIVRVAEDLGMPLRGKRKADLEQDFGILSLHTLANRSGKEHVTFLRWGLILDDGEIWEPDAYMAHYEAHVKQILVPVTEVNP